MKTNTSVLKTTVLSVLALAVCAMSALAESKVTVGVGHMCCASCQNAAKAALTKTASAVSIDGKNVTITMKEGDLIPVLDALSKAGFPATRIDAGSGPVTIGVAHLCCGKCKTGLKDALTEAKLQDLDADSINIGSDSVVVKAKAGKTLDLAPVLAAMEKGGFGASKVTLGASAATAKKAPTKTAHR